MSALILTKSTTPVIGWIALLLGYVMQGIFWVLDKVGVPNIGLAIIIFTIIIYTCMLPMTYKQQKFSKLQAVIMPEVQAIQKKYNGRKDQDSMMMMQNETQAVYNKYGVSQMGSCVQLLVQLPILYALYRVIYQIPAYIPKIKAAFFPLVEKLVAEKDSTEFIRGFRNAAMYSKQFKNDLFLAGDVNYVQNTFIDVLNKASTDEWNSIVAKFPNLADDVANTLAKVEEYNKFFFLNIANSPSYYVNQALASKNIPMIIGALMIPVLAAVSQWLSVKLMPQTDTSTGNQQADQMSQSMKTMNTVMPLMSAVFCYSLPTGVGLYWVASAVVRCVQQVAINKYIDKTLDIDTIIEQNKEKAKKKADKRRNNMEKAGIDPYGVSKNASINTKKVQAPAQKAPTQRRSIADKANIGEANEVKNNSSSNTSSTPKKNKKGVEAPGSISAKANLVRQYNENRPSK